MGLISHILNCYKDYSVICYLNMIIESKGLVEASNVTNPPGVYKDSSTYRLCFSNIISDRTNIEKNPRVEYNKLEEILGGISVLGVGHFIAPKLERINTRKGSDYFRDVRKNLSLKKLKEVHGKFFFKDCHNVELGREILFDKSLELDNTKIGDLKKYSNHQINVGKNLYVRNNSKIYTDALFVNNNMYINNSGLPEIRDLNVLNDIYIKKTEDCSLKDMNVSLENLSKSFNGKIIIEEIGNSNLYVEVPEIHRNKVEYLEGKKSVYCAKRFLKDCLPHLFLK